MCNEFHVVLDIVLWIGLFVLRLIKKMDRAELFLHRRSRFIGVSTHATGVDKLTKESSIVPYV